MACTPNRSDRSITDGPGSTSRTACRCKSDNAEIKNGDCQCKPGWTENPDDAADLSEGCILCSVSTYKNETGNGICTPCPRYAITNKQGSESAEDCKCKDHASLQDQNGEPVCLCNVGAGWDADTETCTPCLAGEYKSVMGNAVCLPCTEGSETSREGATSATECVCTADNTVPINGTCQCTAGAYGNVLTGGEEWPVKSAR